MASASRSTGRDDDGGPALLSPDRPMDCDMLRRPTDFTGTVASARIAHVGSCCVLSARNLENSTLLTPLTHSHSLTHSLLTHSFTHSLTLYLLTLIHRLISLTHTPPPPSCHHHRHSHDPARRNPGGPNQTQQMVIKAAVQRRDSEA